MTVHTARSHQAIYADIQRLSPQQVSQFYPSNLTEQRLLFLDGLIDVPDHHYDKLDALRIESALNELVELQKEIENTVMSESYRQVYFEFLDAMRDKYILMRAARDFKVSNNEAVRKKSTAVFMHLNKNLYSEPEPSVYLSFARRMRTEISEKSLPQSLFEARDRFLELLPSVGEEIDLPYQPRTQTVQAMHAYAMKLYGPLLRYIPEREEKFSSQEIAAIFTTIVEEEFREAAKTWRVVIENAASIKVVPVERKIVIPRDRAPITAKKLRELVAHEIGIHFLRAIAGELTDFPLLGLGLAHSYLFEEGAGKVAEQLVNGEYKDIISLVYFVAGLALEGYAFRDIFEIIWRYELLRQVEDGELPDMDEHIEAARHFGYMTTLRIFRGTDALPWFKDTAYYKGTQVAWQYFDSCVNKTGQVNEWQLSFAFLGKIDPQNTLHREAAVEAHKKMKQQV